MHFQNKLTGCSPDQDVAAALETDGLEETALVGSLAPSKPSSRCLVFTLRREVLQISAGRVYRRCTGMCARKVEVEVRVEFSLCLGSRERVRVRKAELRGNRVKGARDLYRRVLEYVVGASIVRFT